MRRVLAIAVLVFTAAACGSGGKAPSGSSTLSGAIAIDGSSTVYPVTEAVAEEFMTENKDVMYHILRNQFGRTR
jgi:phosphate transport system substrate-binding protein